MNRSANTLLQKETRTPTPGESYSPAPFLGPWRKPAHIPCKAFVSCRSFRIRVDWLDSNRNSSDVLRRRFQINTMSGMGYQYKSIWDAVRVIVAEEGARGLFKGIGPNLLKVAPSMASSWLSFELTRDFLVGMDDRD